MSRPLRNEFPGAAHHTTSRGDRREPIYRDDADRLCQLDVRGWGQVSHFPFLPSRRSPSAVEVAHQPRQVGHAGVQH